MSITLRLIAGLAIALVVAPGQPAGAQGSNEPVARFRALAVQAPGQPTVPVNIIVSRWSTKAEEDAVTGMMLEQPVKLFEILEKMPAVGRFNSPGDVGFALRYAQRVTTNGETQYLFLTDRALYNNPQNVRDREYRTTVIQARIGPSGQGEGTVVLAAKVMMDRRTRRLIVEDWNQAPILLRSLERE